MTLRCSFGHRWTASPSRRTSRGDGCPSCSRKRLEKGFNDLQTFCSSNAKLNHLLEEWDASLNGAMTDYTCRAGKKTWWNCKDCGFRWQAFVSNRTNGDGCPNCRRSQSEKTFFDNVQKKVGRELVSNDRSMIAPKELDLFDPATMRAVEFNGDYWHQDETVEIEKMNLARKVGVELAFVWESDWRNDSTTIENDVVDFLEKGRRSPAACKDERNDQLRGQSFLDFEKRSNFSTLLQQWDHEKNSIKPSELSAKNSRTKIWWFCSRGHSFESTVYNRRQGKGCPYCSKRRKHPAGSKLSEIYPELEALFDVETNKSSFAETSISSKTTWRCLDYPEHCWSTTPRKKLECPYCTNRKVLERFNDVATTDPGVVQFFAPDNDFKLTEVTRGSNKKARWSCPQGHVFEARVKERVNTLNGCPVCSGRRFDPATHSFSAVHPELVHEWIRSVDSELSIDQVRFTSNEKALWRCPKGHVYESRYSARHSGRRCNICAGKKILVGFNDLESQRPDLVALLETDIDPQTVHCGSTSVLTWRCQECRQKFDSAVSSLQQPVCTSCRRSKGETEVLAFLIEQGGNGSRTTEKSFPVWR